MNFDFMEVVLEGEVVFCDRCGGQISAETVIDARHPCCQGCLNEPY